MKGNQKDKRKNGFCKMSAASVKMERSWQCKSNNITLELRSDHPIAWEVQDQARRPC